MKFSVDRSKMMVLGGEKVSICEAFVRATELEYILEFKYLGLCF